MFSSLLEVVFVAQFMDLLIRHGPALPGLVAFLLCLRPLSPSGPLVSGELASVTCHCVAARGFPQSCWPSLVLGLFLGALDAAVALWTLRILSVTTVSGIPSNPPGSLTNT